MGKKATCGVIRNENSCRSLFAALYGFCCHFHTGIVVGLVVTSVSVSLVGCTRGGASVATEFGPREAIADFELATSEARGNVGSAAAQIARAKRGGSAASEDDGDLPNPEAEILSAVQMVVSSARDLVRTATGTKNETDAQGILADAQALLTKAQARASATELMQAMDQLISKAALMKADIR